MTSKLMLVAAAALLCPAMFAATITVTSLADNITADGQVTLREAIQAANTDSSVDGSTAGSGADTIVFGSLSGTISLSIVGDSTVGSSGLGISSAITISGPTATSITISRTGGNMRLFHVASGASLTIENLTLTNGVARGNAGSISQVGGTGGGAAGMGGAIFSSGTLLLDSCTLISNSAIGGNGGLGGGSSGRAGGAGGGPNGGSGGSSGGGTGGSATGIGGGGGGGGTGNAGQNGGPGGNGAFGGGAGGGGGGGENGGSGAGSGASPGSAGTFGGTGSTGSNGGFGIGGGGFGGGGAGMGGAVFANAGSVTLVQCTITGNTTTGGTGNAGSGSRVGGGVFALNTTTCDIDNCTFSGNTGGAVRLHGNGATANARIRSTILANSVSGNDFHASTSNSGSTNSSGTNNIIETSSGFGGSTSSTADPSLGGLLNNGGPTATHVPSATSVALGAGSNPRSLTTDQRGDARVFGSGIDVGSVERGPDPPTVTTPTSASISYTTATLGGNVTADGGATITARGVVFSVTSTNSNPLIGGTGVTNQTTSGTTGVFTVGVSSLTPNTQYSFKAYATNSAGTTYTSVATFTTLALPSLTSIVRAGGTPTNATSVSWTVTFSASVSGVNSGNFVVPAIGISGASVTSVTGSGTTWTVTASTGTGNGTIRAQMPNDNSVSPGVSNVPFTGGEVYTIDKTAPAVSSIVRADANPTNASSVDFTVTFSESVTGVTTGAFAVDATGTVSGSVSGISGSGTTRTVTVNSITGDGTLSIDLSTVAGIQDSATNTLAGTFTTGEAYTVDNIAPTVSSIVRASTNPTNASSVDFTVTFSESVTGVAVGAFAVDATGTVSANVSGVSGSGTTRTVTVNSITGDGTLSIDLTTVTGIQDGATNTLGGTFNTGESYTVDNTVPTVSSIVRANTNPTNASSVDFTVTISESVTGVTTGAFTIDASGVTGASVTGISGSGTTYTVTVSTGTGDGTLSVDLSTVAGIVDAASNVLGSTFTTGEDYTVDKTAPTVSSIVRADANPTGAMSVDFTVTFSESVTGVTTGAFAVDAGGSVTGASITGVSGSGATRTVSVNTGSGDGTLSIDLTTVAGIEDASTNALSGTFTTGQDYTIDKTGPGISIGAPSVSSTITGPVDFTITYTGATAVTLAAGDITLNTTGTANGSVAVTGTGTVTRTVTISSVTGTGTIGISVAASTATDGAGNPAAAAGPSSTFSTLAPPSLVIGVPSTTVTAGGPVDFTITYTDAATVTLTTSDVTVNGTGGVTGTASVSGTGTTTRTVTVNGLAGDGDFTISLAAGTATNASGLAPAAGPSATVDVDNTVPVLTPAGTLTLMQGDTVPGAAVGTASDSFSAAGNLMVTATTLPTGVTVTSIVNTAGTITADISADLTAAVGTNQIEFTVTDEAGNTATALLDLDVTLNTPPTITGPVDQAIAVNASTGALAVTVDDIDEGPNALVLTVTTDNAVLVDIGTGVVVGGAAGSRTVDVTPNTNNVGVATIILTVTDSGGASSTTSFLLTVEDLTNGPTITAIADLTMNRDTTSDPIAFSVDDPQGAGTLTLPVGVSSDLTLISPTGIVIGGTNPDFTITLTPEVAQTGTTVITVSVSDGTLTASRSFTVTVQDPSSSSGGGDDKKDDESCSTSTSSGWLVLLGLLCLAIPMLRGRQSRA